MRASASAFLPLLVGLLAPLPAPAASAPVIGCPSLANLRLLLKQTGDDPVAAGAVLANEKADHLGCAVIPRDGATALAEHIVLNGHAYDCIALRTTSVCHWTLAGSAVPAEPQRAARKPSVDKSSPDKPSPEKPASTAKPEPRR